MIFSIILIVLAAASLGIGIYDVIVRKYDKKKEQEYTKESLLLHALISGISSIVAGVFMLLTALSYESWVLPMSPFYYIGWIGVILFLFTDILVEGIILKKIK